MPKTIDYLTLAQLFFAKCEATVPNEIGDYVTLVCILSLEHECVRPDYVMVSGYSAKDGGFKTISVKISNMP